jgi:hypothetical protein
MKKVRSSVFVAILFSLVMASLLVIESDRSIVVVASPGTITVTGSFESANETGTPILRATVELWDKDSAPNADDLLASGTTGTSGSYTLGPVNNIDSDVDNGALDIYVVVKADSPFVRVYDGDTATIWNNKTNTQQNIGDGTYNFGRVSITGNSSKAFKIYTSMDIGARYLRAKTSQDPSLVTVRWTSGYGKGTAFDRTIDTIYIQDFPYDPDWDNRGVHLHEYGHFVADWKLFDNSPGGGHWWLDEISEELAWSEGWAHFFSKAAVSWELGSEQVTYRDYNSTGYWEFNLESGRATWQPGGVIDDANSLGPRCEGSVAATLWDVYDNHNDLTYDNNIDTLARSNGDIWDVVLNFNINGHKVYTIYDFWEGWFLRSHDYSTQMEKIFELHGIPALSITTTAGGTTNPTPRTYAYIYEQGTVVSVSALPSTGYYFDHWQLDGAPAGTTNPMSVTMNTNHALKAFFVYSPVGGVVVPVDKFGLLAPYIGLASTTLVATVASAVYVKRVKRRKEKQ